MNGNLGLKEIYQFISELLNEMHFNFEDYLIKDGFNEMYEGNKTFSQISAYVRFDDSGTKYYLEVVKEGKVEELIHKINYINQEIENFINDLANNEEVVRKYEKDTFLYFRRVPSDFGINYSVYERNKKKEENEEKEQYERHMEESGLNAFIKKHGYNPCENCYKDCHHCNLGFYDDGRYSVYDVYSISELI